MTGSVSQYTLILKILIVKTSKWISLSSCLLIFSSACPANWLYNPAVGSCYFFSEFGRSSPFDFANTFCLFNVQDSHGLEINTVEELNFIEARLRRMNESAQSQHWIGLRRTPARWIRSDTPFNDTEAAYTIPTRFGEDNTSDALCGTIALNLTTGELVYEYRRCDRVLHFICEFEVGELITGEASERAQCDETIFHFCMIKAKICHHKD